MSRSRARWSAGNTAHSRVPSREAASPVSVVADVAARSCAPRGAQVLNVKLLTRPLTHQFASEAGRASDVFSCQAHIGLHKGPIHDRGAQVTPLPSALECRARQAR